MRAVRWNKRYITGDRQFDDRNRDLAALFEELRSELSSVEHCQEMNELAARLRDLIKQRFAALPGDAGISHQSDKAIRNLLEHDFPLAALSTPACRECGLCDLMKERVEKGLTGGDGARVEPSG